MEGSSREEKVGKTAEKVPASAAGGKETAKRQEDSHCCPSQGQEETEHGSQVLPTCPLLPGGVNRFGHHRVAVFPRWAWWGRSCQSGAAGPGDATM